MSDKYAIDHMRDMIALFNQCRESFNQRHTYNELSAIYAAHIASGWDIYPDQWADHQIKASIDLGTAPQWDENERPIRT